MAGLLFSNAAFCGMDGPLTRVNKRSALRKGKNLKIIIIENFGTRGECWRSFEVDLEKDTIFTLKKLIVGKSGTNPEGIYLSIPGYLLLPETDGKTLGELQTILGINFFDFCQNNRLLNPRFTYRQRA